MRCVSRLQMLTRAAMVSALLAVGGGAAPAQADPVLATGLPTMTSLGTDLMFSWWAPSIAINASGQAVAGWARASGGAAMVAFRSADGTWSVPERLSTPGLVVDQVRVAIDAAGTSTLAWNEGPDYYDRIVHVVRHSAAGFSQAQTFTQTGGGVAAGDLSAPSATSLGLATNESGDALLTWNMFQHSDQGPVRGDGVIFAAKSIAGGAFGPAQVVSEPARLKRESPVGSIGARGDVAVTWTEGNNPVTQVRLRQQPAGGDFAPGQYLTSEATQSAVPNVSVGPDGTATVTWWQDRVMHAERIAPGGALAGVQALPGLYVTEFPFGPAGLAVDAAGRTTAAWVTNNGLWTATADAGADFASAAVIDLYASEPPSVAVEPGGGAVVAWAERTAFHAAWRPAGAVVFRTPATIPGTAPRYPLAALAGGHALLAGTFGEPTSAQFNVTGGDASQISPPAPTPIPVPLADTTGPKLSIGKITTSKRGAKHRTLTVVVSTTEPTRIAATITKRKLGVSKGGLCVAPSGKTVRKTKQCTRIVTIGAPLRSSVPAGSTTLTFAKVPPAGTYDLVLSGSDAARNQAVPVTKRLVLR